MFFTAMFICNLLIPIIMIIAGYLIYKKPPKKINAWIGYRTKLAKKNKDTWNFAHNLCGRLWIKTGLILVILTIVAQIPFAQSADDIVATASSVIEGVQVIVLLGTIIFVENELRKTFDENGNRK